MFAELVPIIFPVVACVLAGFVWSKTGVPFDREFVTRSVMNIGAPCLILDGMSSLPPGSPNFFLAIAISLTLIISCAIAGALILKFTGQPLRSYVPTVMFGNMGNLGLPLSLFAFGQEGLGLAVGFYVGAAVTQFVVAPVIQGRQAGWRTLATTPIVYAAAAGVAMLLLGTRLPLAVANTVDLLGGIAIPLMILALGHALGSFQIRRLGIAVWLSVLRMGLGLAAGLTIVALFELEGVLRGVVLLQASMPVAVFNHLLATRYNRHADDVAGAIVVSTVFSLATLPLLFIYVIGL